MATSFEAALGSFPHVLTEGAVVERLRRAPEAPALHPEVANTALLYDPAGRTVMEGLYRQYLEAGRGTGLPLLLLTPTWRADPERLRRAGLADRPVQADAFRFLHALRSGTAMEEPVFIGGLMGCRGDAYDPLDALPEGEAERFHAAQANALAAAGVDLLYGATLPALSEALGMARAMAATGLPYVLGFPMRPAGTLLDGTPLDKAAARLDDAATPPALGYMGHCVHPSVFDAALAAAGQRGAAIPGRWIGLQANASPLSPEELDGADALHADPPEALGGAIAAAAVRWGLKILGGCCGTDDRLIGPLVRSLRPGAD